MKFVIAALVILLLYFQYRLWGGDDGIPDVIQLQKEVDLAREEQQRLQERNRALEAEVKDLKQGLDAVEERARSELGMIRNDEIYYQIVTPKNQKSHSSTVQESE